VLRFHSSLEGLTDKGAFCSANCSEQLAALAQVKARGAAKRLGSPKNLAEAQRKGAAKMKEAAEECLSKVILI
jgi:hypothetical protein